MKFNYLLILLVIVGLLSSCKSKKSVVRKSHKKEVIVVKTNQPISNTNTTTTSKNSVIKNSTLDYIENYKNTAMESMRKFQIPASITLAQGILESSSGNSELTKKSNNHFGIKCHRGWEGESVYHDDDEKGECFRKYENPATSFKDHSLFLTSRDRYAKLFKLKEGDYVRWAKGLSDAGYATDRRYPAKLIALIEKYDLHKYDTQVLGKKFKNDDKVDLNSHTVAKGDTLYSISKKYGVTVEELKRYNGLSSNDISIDQILLLNK